MRELQRPFHTFMRESSLDEEIGASYEHNAQRYRCPQEKRTPPTQRFHSRMNDGATDG